MKTTLKLIAFFLAAYVPGALAVEFAGVDLPASLDPVAAGAALFVTLFAAIAVADYSRASRRLPLGRSFPASAPSTAGEKATHPLAA